MPAAPQVLSAAAVIEAVPAVVYGIIADYRDGHRRILPRPPFIDLHVEEGGYGAGTRIRVEMRVLGMKQTYRALISEPEPGRVLVEANDTGSVTTFTVDPVDEGRHAHVTIATQLPAGRGARKILERMLLRRMLPPMFAEELRLLAIEATAEAK